MQQDEAPSLSDTNDIPIAAEVSATSTIPPPISGVGIREDSVYALTPSQFEMVAIREVESIIGVITRNPYTLLESRRFKGNIKQAIEMLSEIEFYLERAKHMISISKASKPAKR